MERADKKSVFNYFFKLDHQHKSVWIYYFKIIDSAHFRQLHLKLFFFFHIQNLVYSPEKLRRVRIILCFVGGIVLLALLAVAIYFIVSSSDDPSNDVRHGERSNGIHLEDVLLDKLSARHFNGTWSGSSIIYKENNVSFRQVYCKIEHIFKMLLKEF